MFAQSRLTHFTLYVDQFIFLKNKLGKGKFQ